VSELVVGRSRSQRMLRATGNVFSTMQLILDMIIADVVLLGCMQIRGVEDTSIYYYPLVMTPMLMWLIYSHSGLYRRHPGNLSRAMSILFSWTKVVAALIVLAFVFKVSDEFSRQVIISWFATAAPIQMLIHVISDRMINKYMRRYPVPSLMVGNSKMGAYLAKQINENPWDAHKIVGIASDDNESVYWRAGALPKLGGLTDLRNIIVKHGIKRVYFALSMKSSTQLADMQLELIDLNVDIVWAPDIFGLHMVSPSVKEVAGIPLFHLSESPLVGGALFSKLVLDKVLAVIFLIILSPVMLCVATAVKLTSPGPVLFKQARHGLDGKIIYVLKFRSMREHEEEGMVTQAVKGDKRLTPIGAFLRKSSVDELPQLFNVLKGDMSLVGPRPHALSHNHFYADKINAYMSRHRILPGMTGLAQVNGCRGETRTLEKMEKRLQYDLTYINNWSIWLDIRILLKTVYTLFSKNAY